METEVVIGLEIHAELNSLSKVFCSCKNEFNASQNTNVCPVCLGLPGAIPSLNRRAVELAIMTGLIFDCKINENPIFERKNYFYPDLPKGYQITQYKNAICTGGGIRLSSGKMAKINRIHLEEDSAKLVGGGEFSYIDFNRSGVPLVEIVTEPCLSNTDEVIEFVSKLRDALVFAGISDCRMEEGGLRFDVNMSVREKGSKGLGTRVEMKSLNSFKTVAKAIDYETRRQINDLTSGVLIKQETRAWNDELNRTYVTRDKKDAKDYRYFPDPDFLNLEITKEDIDKVRKEIPEAMSSRVERYRELGLNDNIVMSLTSEKFISDYFDDLLKIINQPSEVANWIINEVLRENKTQQLMNLEEIITKENLASIIDATLNEKITKSNAKVLFQEVILTGKSATNLIKELDLEGGVEEEDIRQVIVSEVNSNPTLVYDYCCNSEKIINYLLGKVMYATNNKGVPEKVREVIIDILEEM